MAESRAFIHALSAVVGFIKDAEQATFALYRISCPSMPEADRSPTSKLRAFDIALNVLLPRIKSEADVNLAAQRISEKLESLTASSETSQESDSSQQATSSSSSPSSAQVTTSSASAQAEPTSPAEPEGQASSTTSALADDTQSRQPPASASSNVSLLTSEVKPTISVKSEAPQKSSANPAAEISQPQQSSTPSPSATSPRSVEAEQTASINSVVPNPSSTAPTTESTPQSERASASAQSSILPLSVRAVSPAPSPVHSVVIKPSAAPALPNIVQCQQPPAPATTSQPSPAPANGHPTPPTSVQPKQPLAPATAPQPSSAQPSRYRYSADQLTASPYALQPTHSPALGASLIPELAVRVGIYQGSTCVVVSELIKHGGSKHEPPLEMNHRVPKTKKLFYLDYFRNERSMDVQRDVFKDHNGWGIDIPRVTCNQHLDLYNSMIYSNPDDLEDICRKILFELEIAIVNRAAVYKWYESLPPTDGRVAYNPRHLAFLQMFEKLESAINRYLHTRTRQLIRR